MFLLDNKPLSLDTPFKHDGISYPANWLRVTSIAEKNAVGITEVPDVTVSYDDRFYWNVDNPKDLTQLKTQWVTQVKDTTNKLLAVSDWMIIRKAERNVDVPQSTSAYRISIINECTRLVAAINACTDVPSLIAIVTTQDWPVNE